MLGEGRAAACSELRGQRSLLLPMLPTPVSTLPSGGMVIVPDTAEETQRGAG